MAIDIATQHGVMSFDASEYALELLKSKSTTAKTVKADLSSYTSYKKLFRTFDLVVTAVPGFMEVQYFKGCVIEAEKNVVDISFFSEDALQLDALAKEKDVTAIVDWVLRAELVILLLAVTMN